MFWVYILRCADGSLYIGQTQRLPERDWVHNQGLGGRYTALRRPVRIVCAEEHQTVRAALDRERQLKGWSRAKKEALICGDSQALKRLSRSRRRRS